MAAMASTAIDTLRFACRLKNAGVPAEQAEAMADAIGSELAVQLVTKTDLDVAITGLDARITAKINKIESSLATIRWMMGFTLAFVVALTWRAFA